MVKNRDGTAPIGDNIVFPENAHCRCLRRQESLADARQRIVFELIERALAAKGRI
jgi:hypothetical protein